MDILGQNFHTEINKFKFLNELVSIDYGHKAFFSMITIDFSLLSLLLLPTDSFSQQEIFGR